MKKRKMKLRWDNIIKDIIGLVLIVAAIVAVLVVCNKTKAEALEAKAIVFDIPLDLEVIDCVIEQCEKYGISESLVFAMIEVESNYQAEAVSPLGAKGLMQIIPKYHQDRMQKLNCTDLFNPVQNVTVGVDYLAELLEKYEGNEHKALTAYNRGETGADRDFFNKGIYQSEYCKKVLETAKRIESEDIKTMFYTDDPERDFDRYDAEQQEQLEKLPVCSYCLEPIQDDYLYEINDEVICEECLNENFRKNVEDYIE